MMKSRHSVTSLLLRAAPSADGSVPAKGGHP